MGVQELKTFSVSCDICLRFGHVVQAPYSAALPRGWEYETLTGCGMTGYTTKRVVCDNCGSRIASKEQQT